MGEPKEGTTSLDTLQVTLEETREIFGRVAPEQKPESPELPLTEEEFDYILGRESNTVEEVPQDPFDINMQQLHVVQEDKKDEKTSLFDKVRGELNKVSSAFGKFFEGKEMKDTLEEAKKDTVLLEYLKEKFPNTFGESKDLWDVAKVAVIKSGEMGRNFTREYYSIQLAVGGVLVVVTGTGGPIGRFVGMACIRIGDEHSKLLSKILKEEDLKKILPLYEKRSKEKRGSKRAGEN